MTGGIKRGGEYARLLAENERYTETFDRSALTAAPLSGLAIVACMDARLDVEETLGLRTGDAHIIRNAGGIVTDDVIRSLIVSQHLLGTNEIVVIEHTGCGLHGADADALRSRVAAASQTAAEDVAIDFGAFADLEANLRAQVARLREHPFVHDVPIHGLIFDVATGRLHEIV
ncbi:MAG: carbonic anhydrase [Chloroflexota bacterium]